MKRFILSTALVLMITVPGWAANLYVSSGGSNTAPYDTWTKAANSIATAFSYASAGDTIYLDNDVYTPSSYISINKSITFVARTSGEATIQAPSGAGRAVHISTSLPQDSNVIFDGIVFDGNNETYAVSVGAITYNVSLEFFNCTFRGNSSTSLYSAMSAGSLTISSCTFEGTARYGFRQINSGQQTTKLIVRVASCDFNLTGDGVNHLYGVSIEGYDGTTQSDDDVVIDGVSGIFTSAGNGATAINVENISDAIIRNCRITVNSSDTVGCKGIWVQGPSTSHYADNCQITNNIVYFNPQAGYGILVGVSTTPGNVHNCLVEQNYVRGQYYATATPHCIEIGEGATGKVRRNIVEDGYVGIVLSRTADVVASYNLAVDCYGYVFACKGTSGAKFINNTVYISGSVDSRSWSLRVMEQAGVNTTSATYENNIIVNNDSSPLFADVDVDQTGVTFDYNVYYSPNTPLSSAWSWLGTDYSTFNAWQSSSGQDSNSTFQNPHLTPTYHLVYNSLCIDAGTWVAGIHDQPDWRDLDGHTQHYGTAPDIGCYEYNSDWGKRWSMRGWNMGGWGLDSWRTNRWNSTSISLPPTGYYSFINTAGQSFKNTGGLVFKNL